MIRWSGRIFTTLYARSWSAPSFMISKCKIFILHLKSLLCFRLRRKDVVSFMKRLKMNPGTSLMTQTVCCPGLFAILSLTSLHWVELILNTAVLLSSPMDERQLFSYPASTCQWWRWCSASEFRTWRRKTSLLRVQGRLWA